MQHIVIYFLLSSIIIGPITCDINPKWEHPHAWGKLQKEQNDADDSLGQSSGDSQLDIQANQCGNRVKYDVLETYYLKLVNYLIGKDRFKFDSNSGNLKRHITIEMSNEDIEQFSKIKHNVHAIDAKLFEILAKNNNGFITDSIENMLSIFEKIEIFLSDKIPLEDLKFFTLIIIFLLFVWRLSRIMKRNIIITFIGVIFLTSYILDYFRCCQEKEIDKLLELQNKSENPCTIRRPNNLIEYIAQSFGRSPQDECKQHLMGNKRYFEKEYCDVWDHFIDYLVYKNLMTFVQKMQHFVKAIVSDTAFPYNMILVAIFLFFLKDLLIAIVTSFIKSIPNLFTAGYSVETIEPVKINNPKIENVPREPIVITVNLNKKKKSKPKISNIAAIKPKEYNDRIEEIPVDEATTSSTSGDDCESDAVVDKKLESTKEDIKVIT